MSVDVCGDGSEAIRMILENDYDVIVTDLLIPHRNGMDLLRAAKIKRPDVLVVIIAGFGSMETLVEAIRMGAYDYLTKPFKLEELRLLLKNVREKIQLQRANKQLQSELSEARKRTDELEKGNEELRLELEETRTKLLEHEENLSALFQQFPFLVGPSAPCCPGSLPKRSPKSSAEPLRNAKIRNSVPRHDCLILFGPSE